MWCVMMLLCSVMCVMSSGCQGQRQRRRRYRHRCGARKRFITTFHMATNIATRVTSALHGMGNTTVQANRRLNSGKVHLTTHLTLMTLVLVQGDQSIPWERRHDTRYRFFPIHVLYLKPSPGIDKETTSQSSTFTGHKLNSMTPGNFIRRR